MLMQSPGGRQRKRRLYAGGAKTAWTRMRIALTPDWRRASRQYGTGSPAGSALVCGAGSSSPPPSVLHADAASDGLAAGAIDRTHGFAQRLQDEGSTEPGRRQRSAAGREMN